VRRATWRGARPLRRGSSSAPDLDAALARGSGRAAARVLLRGSGFVSRGLTSCESHLWPPAGVVARRRARQKQDGRRDAYGAELDTVTTMAVLHVLTWKVST